MGEGDNKLVRVGEMWPIWVSYCFHCFLMSQPATQLHTILPPSQVLDVVCVKLQNIGKLSSVNDLIAKHVLNDKDMTHLRKDGSQAEVHAQARGFLSSLHKVICTFIFFLVLRLISARL